MFDPFGCPECGERFSDLNMPAGLSCGHTLCAQCADAITLCPSPVCTVCKAPVAAETTPNPALADLADARLGSGSWATMCNVHLAEPAITYCCGLGRLLCRECMAEHAVCQDCGAVDAALQARAGAFAAAAASVAEGSQRNKASRAALQASADAAVATVTSRVAAHKARLDEQLASKVTAIRKMCDDGLKQLEGDDDELLVRECQLRAAAQLCASAQAKGAPAAVQTLPLLKSFDILAQKPIRVLEPTIQTLHTDVDALRFEKCVAIQDGVPAGLAISPDCSQFAVSYTNTHSIVIHAAADGAVVKSFGGFGHELGKLKSPAKLAYHPEKATILVADRGNRRIQEFTHQGALRRVIGSGVIRDTVNGIACNGPLVAVGMAGADPSCKVGVLLFDYCGGGLLASFGERGDGVGQVGACTALRFTPDGRGVIVASRCGGASLSQWSISGQFVKEAGRGVVNDVQDVGMSDAGDWLACSDSGHEVVVLSGIEGGPVRRWGGFGDAPGKFRNPVALAQTRHGELWVLDSRNRRVQVFRLC